MMLVSKEEKQRRLSICNGCEFLRNNFELFGITLLKQEKQCKICKCMVDKKAAIEFAQCPKNKWEK